MKHHVLAAAVVLTLCACGVRGGPATAPGIEPDNRAFELTAVAPPVPALKHRFFFSMAEQIPGNAAPLILDSILLMGPKLAEEVEKANDAIDAGDMKTFDSLKDSLEQSPMWDELDPAMRRGHSDFDPPLREKHELTLLPHLQSIRTISWAIRVRALRELRQGKVEEALGTLRLGYELADKVTEPVIVSALVSAGCSRMINDVTARVMTDPGSPNLYWALVNVPGRYPILDKSWRAEHEWAFVARPKLARIRDGEEPTAAEWRQILVGDMENVYAEYKDYRRVGSRAHPDPIKDALPEVLKRARADYAESHKVSVEEAGKVDRAIVLGHFYFRQYLVAQDEVAKLRGLAYPELLAKTKENWENLARLKEEQPTNPFLEHVAHMHRAAYDFARTDRQLAAMTVVEAIRSYAAGHGGKLPGKLAEITETPAPVNPVTGVAFEYRVERDVAVVGDTRSESTLAYTVKIRK